MKTRIFIAALLVIVLVSCSPTTMPLATPTSICLDCNQDGMITPQELRDVFIKMREKVKIIAKYQPSIASILEGKITSLENEVVGSGSNPYTLDLYAEIPKMGQLERDINSAMASINTEQAARDQAAQNLKTTAYIAIAIVVVFFLGAFLLSNQKRSRILTQQVNTSPAIPEKVVKKPKLEGQKEISESTGKPCSKCGYHPRSNDLYCIKCGEKLI